MNTGYLNLVCKIRKNVNPGGEFGKETAEDVFADVSCRLDTIMGRMSTQAQEAGTEKNVKRALIYINAEPRFGGYPPLFDPTYWIEVNGEKWDIVMIHPAYGATALDHYEIEVESGVNR